MLNVRFWWENVLLKFSIIKTLVIYLRSKQKQQMTMNRNKDQRTLTKAEMEIMNIIWSSSMEELSVRDVLEAYQEPKPAYTTVATFMKILTQKGILEPQ